jgi:hypothetical protein
VADERSYYLGKVKKSKINYLDFEIDKLTNSIENVITGDSFSTDITRISIVDLKRINGKNGWFFN